ncbi:MAG: MoaD/ThiS family protein [Chitinophagaceae bacterium]|jgi:molybdopterin synthase sulfur carrier subunit|nr:MoaD/ThiS family protein [Chitinophagaceae bacterium]
MKIQLRVFGPITDVLQNQEMDFAEQTAVSQFREMLLLLYPALNQQTFVIAVNHKMAEADLILTKGDEVALLPPFSGG